MARLTAKARWIMLDWHKVMVDSISGITSVLKSNGLLLSHAQSWNSLLKLQHHPTAKTRSKTANLDQKILNAKSSHMDCFYCMERKGINCVEGKGKQTAFTKATTAIALSYILQSEALFPPTEQNIPLLTCSWIMFKRKQRLFFSCQIGAFKKCPPTPVSLLAHWVPRGALAPQATR